MHTDSTTGDVFHCYTSNLKLTVDRYNSSGIKTGSYSDTTDLEVDYGTVIKTDMKVCGFDSGRFLYIMSQFGVRKISYDLVRIFHFTIKNTNYDQYAFPKYETMAMSSNGDLAYISIRTQSSPVIIMPEIVAMTVPYDSTSFTANPPVLSDGYVFNFITTTTGTNTFTPSVFDMFTESSETPVPTPIANLKHRYRAITQY
jgi:hypothetical protein